MRIFIVEDEFLAAIPLEGDLRAAGWSTLGPFATLKQARIAAQTEQFDLGHPVHLFERLSDASDALYALRNTAGL